MRLRCVMCGKPTTPYAMIGREPIGPKCAARAGLTPKRAPKGSKVRFVGERATRAAGPQNLDLFDEVPA